MENSTVYVVLLITVIAYHLGLWKLFQKAGLKGWEALIPVFSFYIMLKLSGRSNWWMILYIIPVVNVIAWISLLNYFAKSFGKYSFAENALAMVVPFIAFPAWGTDKGTRYAGPALNSKEVYQKSTAREWADAVLFAVVAATLIRGFLFEAYSIPTGSMEKSLMIGDYLYVSKVDYGPRIPITPIAFPFAHHTMPITGTKAYWDVIRLSYHRLPGFTDIKRGDAVVFNYPEGDTVVVETQEFASYYQLVRQMGRNTVRSNPGFTIVERPVDKRENYIKRCQAIAGDTISIINT